MNRFKIVNYLLISSFVLLFSAYKEGDKNQTTMRLMIEILNKFHFDPQKIDDKMSEKIFDLYLKRLDYSKKFLLKDDVNAWRSKYRETIDDEINNGSFEFFAEADNLILQRQKEAEGYYKEFLDKPFDFSANESVETEPKKLDFADNKNALKDQWRKTLKEQVLSRITSQMDVQEKAKEKKDTSVKMQTFAQMEQDARKKTLKQYNEWFRRMNQIDKSERFSAYLETIANTYDPHTDFLPPVEKAEFDAQMSGQFEGIGAQLQQKEDVIKVEAVIPGSASYRQGQLKAGDIILKVGQGNDDPVDVTNMNLDKVVSQIRGKKGTEVRLTVKKPDASIVVIPIIRDKVIMEETFARAYILRDNKKKIGYIRLPGFYADFNHNGGRSSAIDVHDEVEKLKKEKVDGIIIDLRNNGGGSLEEVVNMAGAFINKGPVVQVKRHEGAANVLENRSNPVYDGPVAVLVNNNSASASEILAAALQDYRRAVIIGSNSSFGKGTVQNFINLDDVTPEYSEFKPMGQLKLTIEKFYRVSGGSTQIKGVIPDIILPDVYSEIDLGEKELDYPLLYDEIAPARYTPDNFYNLSEIQRESKERIEKSNAFNLIDEQAKRLKKQRDRSEINLNLEAYRADEKKRKEEGKKFESLSKEIPGFEVTAIEKGVGRTPEDTSYIARDKEALKLIKKDNYIFESVKVLEDMQHGIAKKDH